MLTFSFTSIIGWRWCLFFYCAFLTLSKIRCPWVYEFISGSLFQFHWSIWLFLHQYHVSIKRTYLNIKQLQQTHSQHQLCRKKSIAISLKSEWRDWPLFPHPLIKIFEVLAKAIRELKENQGATNWEERSQSIICRGNGKIEYDIIVYISISKNSTRELLQYFQQSG